VGGRSRLDDFLAVEDAVLDLVDHCAIVAGPAFDLVGPAVPRPDHVVTGVAAKLVEPGAADDLVAVGAALDEIGAGLPVEAVGTGAAAERV
jgi:hypothetical protein